MADTTLTRRDSKKEFDVSTTAVHVFRLRKFKGHILEVEDVHFHHDSPVLLPDYKYDETTAHEDRITGLAVLRACYLHAKDHPAQKMLIAGHTDTSGADDYNLKLSGMRAENVLYALQGDRDKWVSMVDEKHKVEDYQQILKWSATEKGWPCAPGFVDNVAGPKTKAALQEFQKHYNEEFKKSIAEDGAIGPETWGGIFDVYMDVLAKLLEADGELPSLRGELRFLDGGKKTVGCGEHFPIEKRGKDNYRSATNRRVEILFFDPGEEPKMDCHPSAGQCKPKECEIYDSKLYDHRYIPVHKRVRTLKGMVTEVTWGSGINVSYAKATVPSPHWKLGENVDDGAGSKRPGLYLVKTKGSDALTLKIKITENKNVSGTATLRGQLHGLFMEGQCPTTIGEHTVSVKVKDLPDSIQWYRGNVSWGLEVPAMGATISLDNSTRLEVFVVLDNPASFYNPPGVWVEALRFLCDKVGVIGVKTMTEASANIAKYCHSSHALKYDTTSGAPNYVSGGLGGTFQLDNYIKKAMTVVNCYDQAGAVQSLAGALGIILEWYFMAPCGFINTTDLVGIGSCNNPFFDSNGSAPVVGVNDPKRTAFGNHAFPGLVAKVLDACAGPHLSTETKAEYVTAAIDSATTLYATRGFRAGKDTDIQTHAGVNKVV